MTEHRRADDPVVIVGMALEAPGGVDTADAYWALLSEQREALGPVSHRPGLGAAANCSTGRGARASRRSTTWADSSPAQPYSIPSSSASRHARRSRWTRSSGSRCGWPGAPWRTAESIPTMWPATTSAAIVGASALEYGPELAEFSHHSGHLITGTSLGVISGRIAYALDLAGPALTVDTSCSSALTAFHTAVRRGRAGDCDLALAGGVCVMGSPGYFVEFSKQHALSDDGHCRPYSAHASGTVWAEGAAMFLLQRRSGAVARRPARPRRGPCQLRQLRRPHRRADRAQWRRRSTTVRPGHRAGRRPTRGRRHDRGHGTGTRLGDRTELQVAGSHLRRHRAGAWRRCWVRSSPISDTPRRRPGRWVWPRS